MTKLTSKVQYKNFEPGEFVDIKERDYDETIELILSFPWEKEREKIAIDLTNPSVTIEGKNNNYLKFGLFFNQKYVLHYFDASQTLFTKSFFHLEDSFRYIKNYFTQTEFDTTDFKKENTWLKHNLKHFITQDFKYVVTPKSARNFILSTTGINFILTGMFIMLFLLRGLNPFNYLALIGVLLGIFLIGGGLNIILFLKYYNYLKDKVLIMSKGNDIFYFGDVDKPLKFDKKDIIQYTTIRLRNTRSTIGNFVMVEIELKDGTVLNIPNLLIDYQAVEQKLFEYPRVDLNKYPSLRM